MKKLLSVIGALFVGSLAFGQSTKADSTRIISARKVSPDDLKNMPVGMGRDSLTQIDTASNINRVKTSDKQQKAVLDFVKGMPTYEPGNEEGKGVTAKDTVDKQTPVGLQKGSDTLKQSDKGSVRLQKAPTPERVKPNPKKNNKG